MVSQGRPSHLLYRTVTRTSQRWDTGNRECAGPASREEERTRRRRRRRGRRVRCEEKVSRRRMERLRLRKARGREARRKDKAGRFLTHCNAMKKHAANMVQRRKRREAANQRRDEAQAEKWERRD